MPREGMKLIAASEGVKIYCPENGRFSFFNSPYPAHRLFAAIDVYPKRTFGDFAPSPVRGEVAEIKPVKCPQGKGFEVSNCDRLILLRSLENQERWIKILHVEPFVEVGDKVEPGADLGVLLRSGFFDFWTDPHIHVEVRQPSDPIRARGGFRFERLVGDADLDVIAEDLSGNVIESKPEYALVALNEEFKGGIPVDLNGRTGLLDAGIPHYGWMGVHMRKASSIGCVVKLCGREIGTVESIHSDMCVARCCNPVFTVNRKPVRLSLYIFPFSAPLVKIIPFRLGELSLAESESVSVVIS